VRNIVCEGYKLENHRSIAHDVRISFLVTGFASFDGVPVRLVTKDRSIHDAAAAAGTATLVFRTSDYRLWLSGRAPVPGTMPVRRRRSR
ncbi:MAG: hypothetical protein ACREMU_15035, partial [Gemmatimonadaceae bacterium]